MIYLSTCALSNIQDLSQSILQAIESGYTNIELSSCHNVDSLEPIIRLYHENSLNILLHNYFPPPKIPFLLNLASSNEDELEKSRNHVKNNIKLSKTFNAPFYGVHAGFRGSGEVSSKGINFSDNIDPYEESYNTFLESMELLLKNAKKENVILAVENNTPANLVKGNIKDFVLFSRPEEFQRLMADISSNHLGVLLDVAHLKVASAIWKFDLEEQVSKFIPYLVGLHVHDNDGSADTHQNITENSWFLPFLSSLKEHFEKPIPLTLESNKLTFLEIQKAFSILNTYYP